MESFPSRFRELRAQKEKTLKEIAEDIGVTEATLSRYQNEDRDPKGSILAKLADYFNVSVDYLMGRASQPQGYIVEPEDIEPKDLKQKFQEALNIIGDDGYIEVVDDAREKGIDPDDLKQLIDLLYKQKKK